MRELVNAKRLQEFLEVLGREMHSPCTLYLVGGTSLIFFGLREQTTDIDLKLEVDNRHHQKLIETIRRLKEELHLNIEEANPGDFIPLPKGWKDRSLYLGKFGPVTVFHFDLYSSALSKIERGNEVDFDDVISLLKNGRVEWNQLEKYYDEILPLYGKESLKQDPEQIRRNFGILKRRYS